jgi:hypothetical protein
VVRRLPARLRLAAGLCAAAAIASPPPIPHARAEPPVAVRLVPPADRAGWEAAGAPVVIVLPDHLRLDERAEFHTSALLEGGIAALHLDVPPLPGVDASVGLPNPEDDPRLAERVLAPLFAALSTLDAERHGGRGRP